MWRTRDLADSLRLGIDAQSKAVLREFRAPEGSTELARLVFGVETALWSTAAKKAGKWYRGILEATERFMVRWHEAEVELSRQSCASAVGGVQTNAGRGGRATGRVAENPTQGIRRGGGTGGVEDKPRWTNVGRRWWTGWQGTRPTRV